MKNLFKSLLILPLLFSFFVLGDEEETVEEVVVVGSQIKGASISGALPVTVLDFGDIEAIGADGGDELLESVAEQGLNFFNETENASGGVNSARGDMGAYNLRHMGVGNTLVLMNGRRLVNSPGYQTELLGGDYVPTVTVNSTLVPTYGLDRLEILRDGASAIYGSEAIAGVVNNVMQDDYEGFVMRIKRGFYDHFAAD
jgi:Outer membrane cobalamin receptor protein